MACRLANWTLNDTSQWLLNQNANMLEHENASNNTMLSAKWRCAFCSGLSFIPAWIRNRNHYKGWGELIYPSLSFKGAAVGVWEWISNFSPHFARHVITYPYCVSKRASCLKMLINGDQLQTQQAGIFHQHGIIEIVYTGIFFICGLMLYFYIFTIQMI